MKKLIIWDKIKNIYQNFTIEFWTSIGFTVCLIIPTLWRKYVKFDLAKFTEEYYKTAIVCIAIGVFVIFYTDKNKERTKKRIIKKRKIIAENIKSKDYINYEDIHSDINSFLKKTKDLEITYNNTYLSSKEEIAKQEMEYFIRNSNSNNFDSDLKDTVANIRENL